MKASARCVLVVDNDADVLDAVGYNLTLAGYNVVAADTADKACELLATTIVHLAVVDIRLRHDGRPDDRSGFDFVRRLPPYIPAMVFTAYEDIENVKLALGGEVKAKDILNKQDPNAAAKLVDVVDRLFATEVKANFQLPIEGSLSLNKLAIQIEIPSTDAALQPTDEDIRQVFRVLFHDAVAVHIDYLLSRESAPTLTQTGSVIVRARPQFDDGLGAPMVVKLAAREEIEREARNYQRIKRYLVGQHLPVLDPQNGIAYSRQIGGLCYSLINSEDSVEDWEAIRVFGRVFLEESTETVISLLERFFRQTFRTLFEDARREPIDLTSIYTKGLRLTSERLLAAAEEFHPGGLNAPKVRFQSLPGAFLNPILWALPDREFRRFDVTSRMCLCHGDLHGQNILVDARGHLWLIDFARVAESHALRDFAELETDIKFNLLPVVDLTALLPFEQTLLAPAHFQDTPPCRSFGSDRLDHAYQVVLALRRIASEMIDLQGDMREYYQALFFHTLNIMRLRHISKDKKEHALLSAALICQRLDDWPEWDYQLPQVTEIQSNAKPPPADQPEASRRKRRRHGQVEQGKHVVWSRVLGASVFLLLAAGLVALLWWSMRSFNPSWQEQVATLIILSVLIIAAFGLVGLVNGETVVKALQGIVTNLLGKGRAGS